MQIKYWNKRPMKNMTYVNCVHVGFLRSTFNDYSILKEQPIGAPGLLKG